MQRFLAALRNWFREWLGNSAAAGQVMNLITFRDHFSSLVQSAATDLARSKLAPGAATPGMEDAHINAATQIASLWNDRQPIPAAAPAGIAQNVWDCSKQGFELMQAASAGNTAQVTQLQQANAFSSCDPNWVKDILNYVTFLAENGMRDAIPYIHAAKISPVPRECAGCGFGRGAAFREHRSAGDAGRRLRHRICDFDAGCECGLPGRLLSGAGANAELFRENVA